MYAVLVHVGVGSGRHAEALEVLHGHVVPQAKSAPGFLRGTWLGDEQNGHGLMVFDTEEQARQMASRMPASGPDDPVQIQDVHVYEVHAEV